MKHCVYIVVAVLLLAADSMPASNVRNIGISSADGAVVARIEVDGPIRFMHQTEIPKNGKPDRVIVDVLSAIHGLPAKNFADLPVCPITSIRTSQYSVQPEQIVRLVFDMTGAPFYQIDTDGKAIVVTFPDKTVKPFTVWSAVKTPAASQPTNRASSLPRAKVTKSVSTTVAQRNKAIEKDRLASIEDSKVPTPSVAAEAKPAVRQPLLAKPESKKDHPKVAPEESTPPVKAVPEANLTTLARLDGPLERGISGARYEAPATPLAARADESVPVKSVRGQSTAKVSTPAPSKNQKENKTSSGQQELTQLLKSDKKAQSPTKKVASSKVATTTVNKKASTKTPKPKPAKKITSDKPVSTAVANASSKKPLKSKVASTGEPSPDKSGSVAATPTAHASAKPSVKPRATSRFRRAPAEIKGTMVAEFPKRLVVKYKPKLSRDPFEALVNETRSHSGPIETRIPNVEGLNLVGIIESNGTGNRALLEDAHGYSYILKSGDKVKKGYVLRVESDRIYFQIFEYGWSRTTALALEEY